jgi:hypothetical protein
LTSDEEDEMALWMMWTKERWESWKHTSTLKMLRSNAASSTWRLRKPGVMRHSWLRIDYNDIA